MPDVALDIRNLSVSFDTRDGAKRVAHVMALQIAPEECVVVVGESGAGKTQLFLGALGLSPPGATVAGSVKVLGEEIFGVARAELDGVRGRKIGFVPQDAARALSPHLTIETQLTEMVTHHFSVRGAVARERALEWLERVRLAKASEQLARYPHQLSYAARQRVLMAMAMMCEPAVLVVDAPTERLDLTQQAHVLDLINDLRQESKVAVVVLTRDMRVAMRLAQRVAVMQAGEIVETGVASEMFTAPKSDFVAGLIAATPLIAAARVRELAAPLAGDAVLQVDDLRVQFPVKRSALGRTRQLHAIDGVTFSIRPGETLGVVGETGAGKSTLARAVAQLTPRQAGTLNLLGRDVLPSDPESRRLARHDVQIVFDDPGASLDPHINAAASIVEPLLAFEPHLTRSDREARLEELAPRVLLGPGQLQRFPHQLLAEEKQRVGLARALILKPKLLVCDDMLAALDPSARARLLDTLVAVQRADGVAMLFTSSDLVIAREISHKLLVLFLGRAVEYGPTDLVLSQPRHPYTRRLIEAASVAGSHQPRTPFTGDPPDPLDSRASLEFLASHRADNPDAVQYRPRWLELAPGHFVAEHDS